MTNFIQQTNFTLQELVKLFEKSNTCACCYEKNNPGSGLPAGLLVNEIGVIFHTRGVDDEDHVFSESFLRRVMENDILYEGNRAAAYFYLRHPDAKINEETVTAIDSFEKDSRNAGIVNHVLGHLDVA